MFASLLRSQDRDGERPEIDFVAYAADCRVTGRVRLTEGRLSDMLNRRSEVSVIGARVMSYVGTPDLELPELTIYRDDLYAVVLAGPTGDEAKRRETERVALGIKLGPYLVRGYVHVPPGADPIAFFGRSRMVPLTDSWIERSDGTDDDQDSKERVAALLVNRVLADWFTLATVEEPDDDEADDEADDAAAEDEVEAAG